MADYVAIANTVEAEQFSLTDVLPFAADNVVRHRRDIGWHLDAPNVTDPTPPLLSEGDWVVKNEAGEYAALTDTQFTAAYEAA